MLPTGARVTAADSPPCRQGCGGESAQLPGCELRMVKKDGTPEYRVVLTDINKRKEEDVESLRENEARFNQLAASVRVG